jgi:hypothetical protein
MAEDTSFANRAGEIGIRPIFEAGRQIIGLATRVESDWRLEEMSADVDEITAGVVTRANDIVNAVLTLVARILPGLPVASCRGMHGDL